MRLSALLIACALAACAAEPAVQPVAEVRPVVQCASPDRVRASAPSGVRLVEIAPVAPFLAALNAIPPQTHVSADRILVAHMGDAGRVFLFTGGCLTLHADLGWSLVEEMLGRGI